MTAFGTVGAVVAAVYFATRDEWRRISSERRTQAQQVVAWFEPLASGKLNLRIRNGSSQPVYQLVANLVAVQGAFRRTAVGGWTAETAKWTILPGLVPPNETIVVDTEWPIYGGMSLRFGIEIAFQDAAGLYWQRSGMGQLTQVGRPPLKLYGVPGPVSWIRT